MTKKLDFRGNKDKSLELDDAIAALIVNTRRIRRKLNLIEIADKLKVARKYLSTKEIAEKLSLSTEMVREFGRVDLLVPSVKVLIEKRKISGIDIADRLSRLPAKDQLQVAKEVGKGNLRTEDLRALVSLRRMIPGAHIDELIKRVHASKNIKEYVVEFRIPSHVIKNGDVVKERLTNYFGLEHIRNMEISPNGIGNIVLDEAGKDKLISGAKRFLVSKGEMLRMIISHGMVKNAQ